MSEFISLLKTLIQINTTNPPGNEIEMEKIIIPFLEKYEIEYSIHRSDKTRSNIIANIGPKNTKSLLIACHMDVVPAGDGWYTDPFKAVIKNEKIYGRGTTDNKGQLAVCLMALKNLKKIEHKLKNQIILVMVSDEELGSKHGIIYLLENNLIKADYAIIPDTSGNMKEIVVGEKGIIKMEYTFFGKQAHGSTPSAGINANILASDFIQKIKNNPLKFTPHPKFEDPTINIGIINGGSAFNIVPAKCKLILDIRTIPGLSANHIKEQLDIIASTSGKFQSEILMQTEPMYIGSDCEVVDLIKNSTKQTIEITPKEITIGGGTVSKDLVNHSIKSVGFSCGNHSQVHASNEHIEIKELENFQKVIEQIMLNFTL
jgi:succinyl-diaminopimelate desuccinylase